MATQYAVKMGEKLFTRLHDEDEAHRFAETLETFYPDRCVDVVAEDISADDETEAFISGLRDSVHAGMTCARIMAAFGLPGTVFTPADIADHLNDGDFGSGIDTTTAVEMVKSSDEWTRLRESLTVAGHDAIERAVGHISVNG